MIDFRLSERARFYVRPDFVKFLIRPADFIDPNLFIFRYRAPTEKQELRNLSDVPFSIFGAT